MNNTKSNIILSDSKKIELSDFLSGLNDNCNYNFEIKEHIADLTLKGRTKNIRRYLSYFCVPFKYFLLRNQYEIIIGWQQFYALTFCFYCSLFHVKKSNIVIAYNFTYKSKKGLIGKIYKKFINKCVNTGYLDYVHVPSQKYAKEFSLDFSFPLNKIIVSPFGIIDRYEQCEKIQPPIEMLGKSYFLSIGRSNRDYKFLLNSWDKIDDNLVIASDQIKESSSNEKVIVKKNITAEDQYQWIFHAKALIIPIDNPSICSGDTVLLTAMSLKKIVIVTSPSALADMYIKNGYNGILINKDKLALKNTIMKINDGYYNKIKENARKDYLEKYTRYKMGERLASFLKININ